MEQPLKTMHGSSWILAMLFVASVVFYPLSIGPASYFAGCQINDPLFAAFYAPLYVACQHSTVIRDLLLNYLDWWEVTIPFILAS